MTGEDTIPLKQIAIFLNGGAMTFSAEITPLLGILPVEYNDGVSSASIADLDVNGIDDIVLGYNSIGISGNELRNKIHSNQEVFNHETLFSCRRKKIADRF